PARARVHAVTRDPRGRRHEDRPSGGPERRPHAPALPTRFHRGRRNRGDQSPSTYPLPSSRNEVRPKLLMKSIVGSQLLVHVTQFSSRITEEHPARDAVVERAEIQEQQQDRAADRPSVSVEQETLEWGEK